jgi:hypothetical protein
MIDTGMSHLGFRVIVRDGDAGPITSNATVDS